MLKSLNSLMLHALCLRTCLLVSYLSAAKPAMSTKPTGMPMLRPSTVDESCLLVLLVVTGRPGGGLFAAGGGGEGRGLLSVSYRASRRAVLLPPCGPGNQHIRTE